ncbi:MAG: hypothetical protein CME38_01460 [Haliea sp.]|nr:hypothetical protein [Haliea sp.]|tara:strand:- start:83 stop:1108 length:1026 start_codon:yes stop_codon:yes gene_type:complete
MNQELIVKTQPPVLDTNYEALRAHLVQEVERYDIVVTSDTVKDAKKLATELNATKKQLDDRRKQEVAKASEPIKAFDAQLKELVKLCEDGRQKILGQVKTFEEETLHEAQQRLEEYLQECYEDLGVREEYRTASVEGMAKLTTLTKTGKLTAAACSEVSAKVNECRMLQQQTDLRLSQLENECYRAGLHSPLTREHVEGILFTDESQYHDSLQSMIIRELDRQAETERRAREKAEREHAQAAAEVQRQEPAAQPDPEDTEAAPADYPSTPEPMAPTQAPQPAASASGKIPVRVYCTLDIEVSPRVNDAAIEAELRRLLSAAGIRESITDITVQRPAAAAGF